MNIKKLYFILIFFLLLNAGISILAFLVSYKIGIITQLILVFAIGGVLTKLFTRPLMEIKNEIDKVKKGDYSIRLKFLETPVKEINELAVSIDSVSSMLKKSFREISRQKNDQEAILFSMKEGILLLDYKHQIVSANLSASKMLDVSLSDIYQKNILGVIRSTQLLKVIETCLNEFEPQEVEVESNDKAILVRTCPIKHNKYKISGTVLVLNDITQIKKLESYRRQFVTNVSHELKTPLTAIQGFVETLIESEAEMSSEQRRDFIKIINKHTLRLSHIIEDLMQLARIENKKEQIENQKEIKNLFFIVEAAKEACHYKAHRKNIDIQLKGEKDVKALITPGLFEQAIVNLLDNAIKYSHEGDDVHLRVFADNEFAYVDVVDNGIGISSDHIERLFERFYRVDKSRSREHESGGSGIGLSIVKHIVDLHKGEVNVESQVGQGSRFTIKITRSNN